MNVLITGAAGNLGSALSRHLLAGPHRLKLMAHRQRLSPDIAGHANTSVYQADLGRVESLYAPCENTDCIVHFAGRLFAPRPERFLAETNVTYVSNLLSAALAAGVGKFILISFPHVEIEHPIRMFHPGTLTAVETTLEHSAAGMSGRWPPPVRVGAQR